MCCEKFGNHLKIENHFGRHILKTSSLGTKIQVIWLIQYNRCRHSKFGHVVFLEERSLFFFLCWRISPDKSSGIEYSPVLIINKGVISKSIGVTILRT